jgi:dienelactone hydrolase
MKKQTHLVVRNIVGTVAAFVIAVAPTLLADEAVLREFLSRQIISPDLVMMEVERFCDTRVPRMPRVTSVEEWEKHAKQLRRDVLERVALRGQAAKWAKAKTKVEWLETLDGGKGYKIRKLRYEALPGLWIPALLYEPEDLSGKVPVVMNVNGHDGKGKAAPYKQIRCINQAKRGMIALNVEWLGMGQLSKQNFKHYRMNQLDLCGTSGLAPFYLSMKRGLDLLLSHKFADPERVAVAGLSGGGWQTIFISSLDTRVTAANPVAGYSSFITRAHNHSDLGDSEQTPCDMATAADYTHLTALLAPRAALLTYNKKDDCCFASDHALPPLLEAAKPIFKLYKREDRLRWHVNEDPGTHNFERENRQALYRLFADFFYTGDTKFRLEEIECDKEIRTADELSVELPDDNTNFNKLALQLSRKLPLNGQLPRTRPGIRQWRQRKVKLLREIVRARLYQVQAEKVTNESKKGIKATLWKLQLDKVWTLPAVELSMGAPEKTAILVADDGYKSAISRIRQLLADGYRVLALDPFYVGGSKITKRDFLFALLVAAVGDRPLGLQASQLAAVARWLHSDRRLGPVALVACGEQLSLSALMAAALEQNAIERLEMTSALGSLKEVIERNESVDKKPILFCFGLLEYFDLNQLVAIVAPRQVRFLDVNKRVKDELKDLKDFYKTLGKDFDPLE